MSLLILENLLNALFVIVSADDVARPTERAELMVTNWDNEKKLANFLFISQKIHIFARLIENAYDTEEP